MRGADSYTENLFSSVKLEDFVPANHPLRPIRTWVNEALAGMDAKFSAMYEADVKGGRPSIAPQKLMRAMLLQVLFSIRSERQLVEQITYNLLLRWFVGLSIDDVVWNHPVFSKNRDRLIEHEAVTEMFNATVEMANKRGLLSGEHFSVDGTLIKAWASHKSMRRKDGSDDDRPPEDWRGEPRTNDTHESKTDGDSRPGWPAVARPVERPVRLHRLPGALGAEVAPMCSTLLRSCRP
jgi:transposase